MQPTTELEAKMQKALERVGSIELRATDVIAAILAKPPIVRIGRQEFCGCCGLHWVYTEIAQFKGLRIHEHDCPIGLAQKFMANRDATVAAVAKATECLNGACV